MEKRDAVVVREKVLIKSHYGLNVQRDLIEHLSHINDKNVVVEIILTYVEPNRENVIPK